jgi:hypothetical protein
MNKAALGILPVTLLVFPVFVSASTTVCPFSWQTNLKVGTQSADVMALQQFLNQSPDTAISSSGVGSQGYETTYYGGLTAKAVSKFQEKYAADILVPNGLTAGTGIAGASTRAKLNTLCAAAQGSVLGASTQVSAPVTDALTIALSPTQPEHTIAPANALYIPFTALTFTAGSKDVDVSTVTLERAGPGSDSAFYDVGFLDPDGVEFEWGYLNAKHQMVLKTPFTIPAGTTQTYTIAGDMNIDLSGNDGEMPVLQLVGVEASSPVVATYPLSGTPQTINGTLTIGSASAVLSGDDPHGERTRYINDTGVAFAGIRITADSKEDIILNSINWEQAGSASANDLANVVTIVNGASYPAENDGRYYYSEFPGGIRIEKGNSLDILVKGDLTGTGSNRTVKFDLYYPSDVDISGATYGFGITLLPGGNTDVSGNDVFLTDTGDTDGTSLTPFFSGSLIDVSAGTITGASKI